jgi:GNAT superfamily N-acetyltransferase
VNPSLRLRLMSVADLPFADSVRAQAGWNQTLDDWKRFLAMEPDGCFVAEWNGARAGTATTTIYGTELAWIGMVLVHPDYRRRGIGQALLGRCVEYLRGRGVRCIKLDATPLGKPVYDRLGFKEEWTLTRWERGKPGPRPIVPDSSARNWRAGDARLAHSLDVAAFGVSRQRLLEALAPQSSGALVVESASGCIEGYGLIRNGSRAIYLGPVAAGSADIGLRLLEALMARCGESDEGKIYWDAPDSNAVAVAWARQNGFSPQRTLTRMYLGENTAPGEPQKQFALVGPELG